MAFLISIQIADIQHKQHKTKRQTSLSSDNFSSSRSDSWRHHGHCIPGLRLGGAGGGHGSVPYGRHRRRNSWTVTRKPSQDSQLSSSRNDSASSQSTNTWRMSRSSVSSDMSNSVARTASSASGAAGAAAAAVAGAAPSAAAGLAAIGNVGAAAAAAGAGAAGVVASATGGAVAVPGAAAAVVGSGGTGKFSALAQRTQQARAAAVAAAAAAGGGIGGGIMKPPSAPLNRVASDSVGLLKSAASDLDSEATGGKPKLIRQAAILADADSSGSHKSVTFQVRIVVIIKYLGEYENKTRFLCKIVGARWSPLQLPRPLC